MPTLYLSRSPDGAVAEYLRRHPEFLGFQGRLKHELYQVAFDGVDGGADVRTPPQADAVGIPFERLRSSDAKNSVRYAECRDLARATAEKPGRSIEYPSAALENAQNVVGLGLNGWTAVLEDSLPLPTVAVDSVRVLPDGAEP